MLIIIPGSHLDHEVSTAILGHVFERFGTKTEFFKECIELPSELGLVRCGLYGPKMGDTPVEDKDVHTAFRGNRKYPSRCVDWPLRTSNLVTLIAGPNTLKRPKGTSYNSPIEMVIADGVETEDYVPPGHECVLYTLYGGYPAPQEPNDPAILALPVDHPKRVASIEFWDLHALVHKVKA